MISREWAALRNCLHGRARGFVLFGRAFGKIVHAAMNVGVAALVVAHDRVDHRARLLRRGGVVEIDERLAVNFWSPGSGNRRARVSTSNRPARGHRALLSPLELSRGGGHATFPARRLGQAQTHGRGSASRRACAPGLPSCGPGIRSRTPPAAGCARTFRRFRGSADRRAHFPRSGRWSRRACTSRRRRRFRAAAWCRSARVSESSRLRLVCLASVFCASLCTMMRP